MKKTILFVLFCVAVGVASGCSGGQSGSPFLSPGASAPAGHGIRPLSVATPTPSPAPPPRICFWCFPRVVAPLSYNGSTFSLVPSPCWDPFDAPAYVAPSNAQLTLSAPVVLSPQCASNAEGWHGDPFKNRRSPSWWREPDGSYQLYIVGVRVPWWAPDHVGKRFEKRPHDFDDLVGLIGGPVNPSSTPWSFAPLSPGLTLQRNASYVFYVVALWTFGSTASPPPTAPPTPPPTPTPTPVPTFPPSAYTPLAPLSFDGTTFTLVSATCGNLNPTSAPAFNATSQFSFNWSGSSPQTLGAQCAPCPHLAMRPHTVETPSPSPVVSGALYIVAYDLTAGGAPLTVGGPLNNACPASTWTFAQAWPVPLATVGDNYALFVARHQ
ncbi:MAG: hypothetical protein JOY98_08725 [Candidatus Eremiobacteraeota bacterium]|nr:hypothetical protein [Candidatus Eremiobacteraeota bacterium]MBV8284894.1 hypothetical protein [Candidatus Eremiobacteraeota bacterium]